MAFDYTNSTEAEMLEHIATASTASVSMIKAYHKNNGHTDVVDKINTCREIIKRRKMAARLIALLEINKE